MEKRITELTTETEGSELGFQEASGRPSPGNIRITSDWIRDRARLSTSAAFQTAESSQEPTEVWRPSLPVSGAIDSEALERNRRAKVNALMDAECLRLLRSFTQHKYIHADDLSREFVGPKGWLKIALLVRADYLEALDSTLRITPEGLRAWENFKRLGELQPE